MKSLQTLVDVLKKEGYSVEVDAVPMYGGKGELEVYIEHNGTFHQVYSKLQTLKFFDAGNVEETVEKIKAILSK